MSCYELPLRIFNIHCPFSVAFALVDITNRYYVTELTRAMTKYLAGGDTVPAIDTLEDASETRRAGRLPLLTWWRSPQRAPIWGGGISMFHCLPCYLVPSSRGRLLVISMTISLQASRSLTLVSPHSSLSVQFVMALMSSSHRARGLPLFLASPPIPNIIDFSKLFSLRMMCPKYDSCCFCINASIGLVVLISSITDLLVILAVHGILSSLLQHHNSKLSILLLSAFLIVHDSQPYSTTGKTNAFRVKSGIMSIVLFPANSLLHTHPISST